MKHTNRALTVVALLFSVFLAAMESTVVSTAMPSVVGELGGIGLYAWVFAGYMLASTVSMPIFGKLADLHGRKVVMMTGLALFLGGSFACGRAPSVAWLIAFRAVQGLGAGAIQPTGLTIIGDLFDFKERARVQGMVGAVWGLAGLAGPLLGGALVHFLSWRWVFYINVPFVVLSAAVFHLAFHEDVKRHEHRLDLLGALLMTLTVTLLLVAARSRATGLIALPVAMVFFLAFLRVEKRSREPMLPLDLFKDRVIATGSLAGGLIGGSLVASVSFVPLYVQAVLGASPAEAGGVIAPMAIGWPIASALSGRLLRTISVRRLIRVGFFMAAASAFGTALVLRPGQGLWPPRVLSAVLGFGLGLSNTPLLIAVQSRVPWNRRGVATANTMFCRTIGGALSVGLLGGVLAAALSSARVPAEVTNHLLGPERRFLSGAAIEGARGALAHGLATIFWAIAALAAVALAASWLFPRIALDEKNERA